MRHAPPMVSVILPCFNVETFVAECLDSLLRQSHQELEVIAIDDGSTDETLSVLERYSVRDSRVRVLRNEVNSGLILTLNRGVEAAHGAFIARMDADATARPDRIALQLEALVQRPEVGVVGTGMRLVDEHGQSTVRPWPVRCVQPAGARFMALFANPLAHVTILSRAAVIKGFSYGQDGAGLHTEDYELFTRMLEAGVEMMNIPQALVTVRQRQAGVSRSNEDIQVANFIAVSRRHLRRSTGIELSAGAHRVVVNRLDRTVTSNDLREGLACLRRLELEALSREPTAVADIRRVADLQRADVLIQAALKGSIRLRAALPASCMRHPWLMASADVRRYVTSKFYTPGPKD